MKLEVLLSVMNIKKNHLDNMNITSDCVVINQCNKNGYEEYKNFKIYSYDELGISNSRNRALEHCKGDILLFCDDDVIYYKDYENKIINEFKNNKNVDVIMFNLDSINRYQKKNKKNKRLHIYNSLKYGTFNIAVKRKILEKNNINFNKLFGSREYFNSGEDTLFIVDLLKNNAKIYSSKITIGKVSQKESTWFKGYNEKYFIDRGAIFCAINKRFRYLLFIQYLVRHKQVLVNINLKNAFKLMCKGAKIYMNDSKGCNNE